MSPTDLALAGAGLLSAACALRPPVVLETPEGVIRSTDQGAASHAAEILEYFGPRLRQMFGTEPRYLTLDLGVRKIVGLQVGAYSRGSKIVLESSAPGTDHVLVHELVHVYTGGPWDALPCAVDEGLAVVLSFALTVDHPFVVEVPDDRQIERALDANGIDLVYGTPAIQAELGGTGVWIATTLGWTGLESLVARAADQGLDRVPTDWFLAALPEVREPARIDPTWTRQAPGGHGTSLATGTLTIRPKGAEGRPPGASGAPDGSPTEPIHIQIPREDPVTDPLWDRPRPRPR